MTGPMIRSSLLIPFIRFIVKWLTGEISGTSKGYELQLSPGRNKSLWLMDSLGEARQITGISFHRNQG